MSTKLYLRLTAVLFAAIAVVHAHRLIYHWPVSIGGQAVDFWVNWVALLLAGFLAWQGFRLSRR